MLYASARNPRILLRACPRESGLENVDGTIDSYNSRFALCLQRYTAVPTVGANSTPDNTLSRRQQVRYMKRTRTARTTRKQLLVSNDGRF